MREERIGLALLAGLLLVAGCLPSRQAGEPVELPSLEDILEPLHPDEPLEYTLHERFSLANSLWRIGQIRDFGRQLGLAGEAQMAFTNWLGTVEGTVRKQDFEIKRLQLELARRQYRSGEIGRDELNGREEAFQEALGNFRAFWESFRILD